MTGSTTVAVLLAGFGSEVMEAVPESPNAWLKENPTWAPIQGCGSERGSSALDQKDAPATDRGQG
jgi:hypothetical protein